MGGCGIAIKKRGSPVVMLLMMEYSQGENVTHDLRNACRLASHEAILSYIQTTKALFDWSCFELYAAHRSGELHTHNSGLSYDMHPA